MICVHNVVAASAVAGLVGKEGAIIRLTLLPFATYALLAGALGYAIVWYSRQGWVNPGTVIVLLIAAAVLWLIASQQASPPVVLHFGQSVFHQVHSGHQVLHAGREGDAHVAFHAES